MNGHPEHPPAGSRRLARRRFLAGVGGAVALGAAGGLAPGRAAAGPRPATRTAAPLESLVSQVTRDHPRVVIGAAKLAEIRTRIAEDETSKKVFEEVRKSAESILDQPPPDYEFPQGRSLLPVSRLVLARSYTLALTARLTDDERYVQRLWAEFDAVARFKDWDPKSFLSTAEMLHAYAVGYDWLHERWTPEQRERLAEAMVRLGLEPGMEAYNGNGVGTEWVEESHNWNAVCNGGLGMAAIALADAEPDLAEKILQAGLKSVTHSLAEFAPDGGYPEGLGFYWAYATRYLVPYLATLVEATGSDRGLSDSPGLSETGYFPIHLSGPTGKGFNFADAEATPEQPAEMHWLAKRYGNTDFGWWGKLGTDSSSSAQHLIWYDPAGVGDPISSGLPLEGRFRHVEAFTARSAWENPSALFAGFKGGDNQFSHGDLDLGTFVVDALGVRWADDLGGDSYSLPGYWDRGAEGRRWNYYRKRAEGSNTLVVDAGRAADQDPFAKAAIVATGSSLIEAFAVADLGAAHAPRGITSWRRGVRLLDHRRRLLVQDETSGEPGIGGWWFLHTRARVEVADDGRSAILTRGRGRMLARILSPAKEATFTVMDAVPLWTSPNPKQTANNGVRKLAIRLEDLSGLQLAVLLTPLREHEEETGRTPKVTPLASWRPSRGEQPLLSGLSVDGEAVAGFSPRFLTYDVEMPAGAITPPKVTASVREGRARVRQAATVPGTAEVEVRRGRSATLYQVHFGAGGGEVVTGSIEGNNPADYTIDGNTSTFFSAEGDGQWVRFDLGAERRVRGVALAWYLGDTRRYSFDVQLSGDGETWTSAKKDESSGQSAGLEEHTFTPATARYVRVVGYGNTASDYLSLAEFRALLEEGVWPDPADIPVTLDRVQLAMEPAEVAVGGSARLRITGTLTNGEEADLSGASVRWYSSDPDTATVDAEGRVTFAKAGPVDLAGIVTTPDRVLKFDRRTVTVGSSQQPTP